MELKNNIQFLALLRGINVGGNNIIKMSELKNCFVSMGFTDVESYIQSGNIIFNSENNNLNMLTDIIEIELSKRFNYKSKIVLTTFNHIENVVTKAPSDFGLLPDKYKYDVAFLKFPLLAVDAIKNIIPREGIDTATDANNVLYFSRLISKAGQSYLKNVTSLPIYKNMTIRNWNTTRKIYELMR